MSSRLWRHSPGQEKKGTRMASTTNYRAFRLLIPLIMLGYLAVAFQAPPAGFTETFPFFNWRLFPSAPPGLASRPEILVHSIDGKTLEPPELFYSLGDHFRSAARGDVLVSKTTVQLARAIARGNPSDIDSLIRVLEETYFSEAREMKYSLVQVSYDPIERYRTGEIRTMREIAAFAKGLR